MTYIPVALRQLIYEQAEGRCEYCLIPDDAAFAPHEIDHVIAEKHGGLTEANNLALSCSLCNKQKGSDLTSIDTETIKSSVVQSERGSMARSFSLYRGPDCSFISTGAD